MAYVNAGVDIKTSQISIKIPVQTSSDIKSVRWSKISGPSAYMTDLDSRELKVTFSEPGTYIFRVTGTYKRFLVFNGTVSDTISVFYSGPSGSTPTTSTTSTSTSSSTTRTSTSTTSSTTTSSTTTRTSSTTTSSTTTKAPTGTPVANAGPDRTVLGYVQGTNSYAQADVILDGSKSVGSSFSWEKVSGGDATTPENTQSPTVTLKEGVYVYRIRVNGTLTDDVTITVVKDSNPNPPVNDKLALFSDFESSSPFTGWITGTQSCKTCPYSFAVSTEQKRAGSKSLRFEVRDQADNIVSKKHRSEIIRETGEKDDYNGWYGMSFFLQDWAYDAEPESIVQWHHSESAGSPPFAIWIEKGDVKIIHTDNVGVDINFLRPVIGKAADWNNKWVDVVLHIKWEPNNTGIIEAWVNGVKVYSYSGVTNYANTTGNYLKLGIYKWPWTNRPGSSSVSKRVLFVDNFKIGRYDNPSVGYDDVKPV